MLKGEQLEVRTPGKNQKRYLAAALDPATGQTYYVLGPKKNNALFRKLLDHLQRNEDGTEETFQAHWKGRLTAL
jgi:hypothetical protein